MAKVVLGIFQNRDQAEDSIEELEDNGYKAKDISIIMKDAREANDLATDTGASVAEGALTGATTGGVIGGIAGLLIGIGAITLPGLGALFIAGPVAAALGLTGAAASTVSGVATGALAGGLLGMLMGLGIPKEEAEVYEERIREGGILVAVPASVRREHEVIDILESKGADQISTINSDAYEVSEEVDDYKEMPGYTLPPHSYGAASFGVKGGETTRSRKKRGRK